MKGHFYVIFCSDVKLTIELLEGDIYLNDLVSMLEHQLAHKAYNRTHNVITDVRNAQLHITAQEMDQLVNFIAEQELMNIKKKMAMLTKDPGHVVASTLFSLNMKDSNSQHAIKLYSTEDAVLDWLHLPWMPEDYKKLILKPEESKYEMITSK